MAEQQVEPDTASGTESEESAETRQSRMQERQEEARQGLAAAEAVGEFLQGSSRENDEELPDAVPGLEVEVRRAQAELVAPVTVLPSAAEFEASMAMARVVAGTKFVPDSYRGSPEEVVAAIFKGREMGIGPMQALSEIHMIDGRAVLSASLMMGQMRRGGVEILESESTEERARIKARRRDTGEIAEVEWTMEQARQIKRKGKLLVDGDNWKNYPVDMLWARCVGRLARRLGSDLLSGMVYTSEEMKDLEGWDNDGYESGAAPPPLVWGEFNPGEILHPDTPKGWRLIMEWLDYVDSTVDWKFLLGGVFSAKYGAASVRDLGEHYQVASRRAANLAGYLRLHVMEGKEFPPPSEEEIIGAVQWAFENLTLDSVKRLEAEEGEVVDEGKDSDAALTPEEQEAFKNAVEADTTDIEFGPEEEATT